MAAPELVASANWMASGAVVAGLIPEGLVVDIGSTTTDLIVVRHGAVEAQGDDDGSRLVAGELVYSGVVRTPVMALAPRVPFAGAWVPRDGRALRRGGGYPPTACSAACPRGPISSRRPMAGRRPNAAAPAGWPG